MKRLLVLLLLSAFVLVLASCDTSDQVAEALPPTATLAPIVSQTPRFTATPIPSRTPLPSRNGLPMESSAHGIARTRFVFISRTRSIMFSFAVPISRSSEKTPPPFALK